MPWYRRLAWCFYPRILVLGMGRFQAGVAFLAWLWGTEQKMTYICKASPTGSHPRRPCALTARHLGVRVEVNDGYGLPPPLRLRSYNVIMYICIVLRGNTMILFITPQTWLVLGYRYGCPLTTRACYSCCCCIVHGRDPAPPCRQGA